MAAISAAAVSGSAVVAPAASLSSSAAFRSSRAQQLPALRSPASLNVARIVAVRASHNSENSGGSAKGLDLNGLIDNVKELSRNISSSNGEEGKNTIVELAKRAAQQAAGDFASGDVDSKTNKLLNTVKELVSKLPYLEGNQEAKNAATDIAKKAAQGAATNAAQNSDGNTVSNLLETAKTLSSKIPGFDGDKMVQNAAVDIAKGAAVGAASKAAREFADNAKNNIGKALLNKFTGNKKEN